MSRRKKPQSFREWFRRNISNEMCRTICIGGCNAGIPCLIYYCEISPLYETFKDEIWTLAVINDADSLMSLIKCSDIRFPCHFETQLVWAAAEQLASERLSDRRWP